MKDISNYISIENWKVKKIGVIGPGIVGMPMAAMLAHARIKIGCDNPAKVIVIQRNSVNSGWKVDAINKGKSVIGGIEPQLDDIVAESVAEGVLMASHDYSDIKDADVILISVQTDKKGLGPDYGPLFGALNKLTEVLKDKPLEKIPLIIFESTLAPSSMLTLIKDLFAKFGLIEGKDILLGNSPNRVMPGRLVERIKDSDKLVAGLHPITPELIKHLYSHIITKGNIYITNSLTAEIVKTLENAYRDVRIAFSAEIVRYCDNNNINFYQLRDEVNKRLSQTDDASDDPVAVPVGGLLVPTVGVGGHCLPKDGILLWWRKIEKGENTDNSLILKSREINNESPLETIKLSEKRFGNISGSNVTLLGAAYRFNSEDTRNSPTLELAKLLIEKGCIVKIHDPFVKPSDQNICKYNLKENFTNDLAGSVKDADYIIICTSHKYYLKHYNSILNFAQNLQGIIDGCNIFNSGIYKNLPVAYTGIGRGKDIPCEELTDFVYQSFIAVEKGVANELKGLINYLNVQFANDNFNIAEFENVKFLADTCSTGCRIVNPGTIRNIVSYNKFSSRLVECAINSNQ